MKIKTILFILSLATYSLVAQDTLTVLQYNLLNYGNNTDYCTQSNNNINDKDAYIRTIIDYVKPDMFCVNEISKSPAIHQRLLDNSLNVAGVTYYRKADFIKVADSYLVNMLYYNSEKLQLHSHTIAQSYIRDIDVYKLFYRSDDLPDGDTAFIICIVAHFKAGNTNNNRDKRTVMANNAMDYIADYEIDGNLLFMGDFNVYTSSETAYQLLLDYVVPEVNFFDPIDTPGSWNNNSSYSNVHTQSTHSDQNGCASYGGMDDRFDFILISNNIKQGLKDVEYIDDSYITIGQDGLHYNQSVNDPPANLSAPSDVINALYGNSDHLPVSIKLKIDKTLGLPNHENSLFTEIKFNNPVSEIMELNIYAKAYTDIKFDIINMTGVILFSDQRKVVVGENRIEYNLSKLDAGIYIAVFTDDTNGKVIRKIVKK